MTLDPNSPWAVAQGASPTTRMFSPEDLGVLCSMWIRDPQLFRRAMPHLDAIHFTPYRLFEYVFTSLSIAERQFGQWNQSILIELIREQAQSRAEPLMPGQLERLTAEAEGGFIYDAFNSGSLTESERVHANQLQQRFLVEKTVFQPLRSYANPGRLGQNLRPENVDEFLQSLVEQQQRLQVHQTPEIQSVQDLWQSHEERLDQFRGRRMVGLETGLNSLDRNLIGLRGVTLLGAAPGAGKTVLCLQLAHGVCQRAATNNAIVVFFSLELSKDDLMTRLKCHLTQSRWRDYVRGVDRPDGTLAFTHEQSVERDSAYNQLVESTAGNRLVFFDRSSITNHSAEYLSAIVNELKAQSGAERVLIVLDYLQLLELDGDQQQRSDLESDKARFRVIQKIAEMTRSVDDPFSSAVLAISEARKPVGDARQNQIWGTTMADLMGTSRLGYGADAVLMMRRMKNNEMTTHYGVNAEDVDAFIHRMSSQGIAPLILSIGKGRDGMMRGDIPLEFHFNTSTMTEIGVGSRIPNAVGNFPRQRPQVGTREEVTP